MWLSATVLVLVITTRHTAVRRWSGPLEAQSAALVGSQEAWFGRMQTCSSAEIAPLAGGGADATRAVAAELAGVMNGPAGGSALTVTVWMTVAGAVMWSLSHSYATTAPAFSGPAFTGPAQSFCFGVRELVT
jgi:hypothetical protein